MLSLPEVSQAPLQHWAGIFAFAAGFRRPLFSILESMFTLIVSYEDVVSQKQVLPDSVIDEVLVAAFVDPFVRTDLRAPIRRAISISDASETGGSASEAVRFSTNLDNDRGLYVAEARSILNEGVSRRKPRSGPSFCAICTQEAADVIFCGPGCDYTFCSVKCMAVHRERPCRRFLGIRPVVGLCVVGKDPGCEWELFKAEIEPMATPMHVRSSNIVGLVVVVFDCCAGRDDRTLRASNRRTIKHSCWKLRFFYFIDAPLIEGLCCCTRMSRRCGQIRHGAKFCN